MKKILTIILDGFGYREEKEGNAIIEANPECFNELWNKYPHTTLYASEEYVGLPKGQFGNSEVGHMTIGAGRIIKQNENIIDEFLESGVSSNEEFLNMISYLKETEKTVHIMGLYSPGGVHSQMKHFLNMYDRLMEFGIDKISFELITDGRDTAIDSAYSFIKVLEDKIRDNKNAIISSICGRYYAMDRDNKWDRIKTYYDLICNGKGVKMPDIEELINQCYKRKITDEFLPPLIAPGAKKIMDGDVILWMNYRNDRARQIISSLTDSSFNDFNVKKYENLKVYSFFNIAKNIKTINFLPTNVVENPLGLYLSKLGITQARIAETEKYAHVTFFFDGTYNGTIEGCNKYLLNSPSVATYDMQPEMSAYDVTKKTISCLEKDVDFVFVNYANPDMVGHTGNYDATVNAIKAVDECLKNVIEAAENNFYKVIILADHGNADIMYDSEGNKVTTHTLSKVPFIITDTSLKLKDSGDLTDVAPTILDYLDIAVPKEMEGKSLIIK